MAALGVQSMVLPTPYGDTSSEWIKQDIDIHGIIIYKIVQHICFTCAL